MQRPLFWTLLACLLVTSNLAWSRPSPHKSTLSTCQISSARLPIGDPQLKDSVEVRLYQPRKISATPRPVVLALPPIHGMTFLDRRVAGVFCRQGLVVLIVNAMGNMRRAILKIDEALIPDAEFHDHAALRSIQSVGASLDWLARAPHFDMNRVGIYGMSLGAMLALLNVQEHRGRFHAMALVAGAANLPATLALSKNEAVSRLRERRMRAWKLTSSEGYQDLMDQKLKYNPQRGMIHITIPSWLAIAQKDRDVPSALQEDLWQQLGRPEVFRLNARHGWTLFSNSLFHVSRVAQFFARELRAGPIQIP